MGIFKDTATAFKRATNGEPQQEVYAIKGHTLTCSHCGKTRFVKDYRMLNSKNLTFLDIEWLNQNAAIYICKNCGHIEWFIDQ